MMSVLRKKFTMVADMVESAKKPLPQTRERLVLPLSYDVYEDSHVSQKS